MSDAKHPCSSAPAANVGCVSAEGPSPVLQGCWDPHMQGLRGICRAFSAKHSLMQDCCRFLMTPVSLRKFCFLRVLRSVVLRPGIMCSRLLIIFTTEKEPATTFSQGFGAGELHQPLNKLIPFFGRSWRARLLQAGSDKSPACQLPKAQVPVSMSRPQPLSSLQKALGA